jgi:hypothetical protein
MSETSKPREWPIWLAWLLLSGASLIGFVLVEGLAPPAIAATAALILAAAKIHIVFDQYMEVGWRHWPLRQFLAGWLAVVTAILLVTYWLA